MSRKITITKGDMTIVIEDDGAVPVDMTPHIGAPVRITRTVPLFPLPPSTAEPIIWPPCDTVPGIPSVPWPYVGAPIWVVPPPLTPGTFICDAGTGTLS